MILELKTDNEILMATNVMNALRPQLNSENIVPILRRMMRNGYHLIGWEEEGSIVAALGYRFTEHLHWGKAIYIDDLSTLEEFRKRGFAGKLLDHVRVTAIEQHCNEIHLDSGLGANRYAAHRFYLNYGFNITSHHFALPLNK